MATGDIEPSARKFHLTRSSFTTNPMPAIDPLQPGDWTAAMLLAHARLPEAERDSAVERATAMLAAGILDPRFVWVAREHGKVIGVQVCVPLPGCACTFWLPMGAMELAERLVGAALRGCQSAGCKIAQAAVPPEEMRLAEPLLRSGFRVITRMHELAHDLSGVAELPSPGLRLVSYHAELQKQFLDTLQRTYEGTLDCPELNGVRTMKEVLEGHRGQGKFDPAFWWLAFDGESPAGVLFLNELPDGVTWEVSYLGIVPGMRRRGLGRALILHALHALRGRPAIRLTLAVDARNEPALSLYRSLGFKETACNEVLLHFFR